MARKEWEGEGEGKGARGVEVYVGIGNKKFHPNSSFWVFFLLAKSPRHMGVK